MSSCYYEGAFLPFYLPGLHIAPLEGAFLPFYLHALCIPPPLSPFTWMGLCVGASTFRPRAFILGPQSISTNTRRSVSENFGFFEIPLQHTGVSLTTKFNTTIQSDSPYPQWPQKIKKCLLRLPAEDQTFSLEATITFSTNLKSLYVLVCSNCGQDVRYSTIREIDCMNCDQRNMLIPRCKFEIHLEDSSGSTIGLIMDKEAEKLLSLTAEETYKRASDPMFNLPKLCLLHIPTKLLSHKKKGCILLALYMDAPKLLYNTDEIMENLHGATIFCEVNIKIQLLKVYIQLRC